MIAQRVDPASRLVDVMVTLPADAGLMLEEYVVGRIPRSSGEALIVPRDAALPGDGNAYTLFTIKNAKAVKHSVRVGVETDTETQVIADDLKEGDSVAVTGSNVLEDGMDVQVSAIAAPPATTQATTMPPTSERTNVKKQNVVVTSNVAWAYSPTLVFVKINESFIPRSLGGRVRPPYKISCSLSPLPGGEGTRRSATSLPMNTRVSFTPGGWQ